MQIWQAQPFASVSPRHHQEINTAAILRRFIGRSSVGNDLLCSVTLGKQQGSEVRMVYPCPYLGGHDRLSPESNPQTCLPEHGQIVRPITDG